MPGTRFKYFKVATTSVVKAKTQADAEAILAGTDVEGDLLAQSWDVDRLTSLEARDVAERLV